VTAVIGSVLTGALTGTVMAIEANYYRVRLDSSDQILLCICRSRLKKIGQQVYVGDRVEIEEPDWQGLRGAISGIVDRQNLLDRPTIANVDRVLLVFALQDPPIEPLQLSRFLVAIAESQLPIILCLSKADLVSPEVAQAWRDRLKIWGYEAIAISMFANQGLTELKQALDGITVIAGASGVGKSSLINWLAPQLNLRTGEISGRLRHGRHTTRHVELFPLGAGLIADTPGFIQPNFTASSTDLVDCFPEAKIRLAVGECQFHNCLHRSEPGCVVRGDWERYGHYLLFLSEILDRESKKKASHRQETGLKSKSGQGGKTTEEPMLIKKKHRRNSRRSDRQDFLSEPDND
jgi:ribosome biogenesis GTPase / thiamine phosphate phosphatase